MLINYYARKSPHEYVHSVRIELAKLILVGTRATYQATGDAGFIMLTITSCSFSILVHIVDIATGQLW